MSFSGTASDVSGNPSAGSRDDAANYLRNASFSRGEASTLPATATTASDLLNAASFDPSRLHPMAGLGDKLDYLSLDDEKTNALPGAGTALPSRGWSDDLCYGTGTTYLSGLALGGIYGVREGYTRPLSVSSTRLRVNSILNSVSRRGSYFANSAGVIALMYNILNSSIDSWRGKHDVWGSMAAGGLSGAIYKSTAGVRPALAAAGIMTGLAGTWSWIKRTII